MKCLGYAPDEEDLSQTEEHEFYSGLIIKIGVRCFFCDHEGHFRMDCLLFWEAMKNQNYPKRKLALAAVQNTRNRQAEIDLKNTEAASGELTTKTVKAVMQVKTAMDAEAGNSLEINYEKAAAEAINKVKQDLATKEIEQRLRQEIETQKLNDTLCRTISVPEATESATSGGNCNTLKIVTGKPFGIMKIEARVMSILTVGGHEVTRNLSEPSDQTIMHIDVYADFLSAVSPQTTSRAVRALLTRGAANQCASTIGTRKLMVHMR